MDSVRPRLLLVEDNQTQGAYVKETLERSGYEVDWASSGIEGLKLARANGPQLVILDVVMEDMDGFAVCRWLKLHEETRDIPVLMLTIKSRLEDKVEGLQTGADDYLPKPFEAPELEARVFALLRAKAAQVELRKRNTQLESMLHNVEALAVTDPLTGLFNRRRFMDVLRREFAVTKRYQNALSCILIDLDHFKDINDQFGHMAGDAVLKEVATKLVEHVREVDVVTRYGGEEFVILLPHTPKEGARQVAERIAEVIRGLSFEFDGGRASLSASFGVSDIGDVSADDPEQLVKAADAALYEAKQQGRDRVIVFQSVKLG
jgi:two-component system cell cycle response regulator